MFTGLVEEAGTVVAITRPNALPASRRQTASSSRRSRPDAANTPAGGIRLAVESAIVGADAGRGDSIAVNGCCLTLVGRHGRGARRVLEFDLLEETWRRTSFAGLQSGSPVNLERSLRVGDRLGGHFVTGHVDGTGRIVRWEVAGADHVLDIAPPRGLLPLLVEKGSVAVDGISLTVAAVTAETFRVWIIPHTHAVTNLRARKVGDLVNLEADLIAKHVARLVSGSGTAARAVRRTARPVPGDPRASRARSR
ncbi:MAG: riboflavin synthase [Limisphaerales bacterium]